MKIIKYIFPFLFFQLLTSQVSSQTISIHHPQLRFLYEDSLLLRPDYHSALQPVQTHYSASLYSASLNNASGKFSHISPVIDAQLYYNHNTRAFSYKFTQGAYMTANLGKRAGFELSAELHEQKFSGESYSIDSLKLVPRYNRYLHGKGEQAVFASLRGNFWWKANKWLTFTAGNDKHFIGDGRRSLLLSENAAAYPFFQTQLSIWKIRYQHQIMFMRDLVEKAGSKRFPKYISQHVLSYNYKNRFNFYIFEAVIWRKQDSVRHRNFDVTYLNPFIFYRPVEYNHGSPDNVLMGLGGKWRVFGRNYLYGQFLLDEFNFKYVSKNDGWWGSKYGYQAGFKTYGLFKERKSLLLLEYCQMRPFTYAHSYSLQNYGYLQQPLAHPLGSNFREMTGELRVVLSQRWMVHASGFFQRYGTDPEGLNYGSDIYKRQFTFSRFYGNYIGDGILHTILHGETEVSRILVPAWRMTAFVNVGFTLHKVVTGKESFLNFGMGIKTLLYE